MEILDWITTSQLDRAGAVSVLLVIALLVITGKLVWHTRLKEVQDRADRWEKTALDLLISARAGVTAAEVTAAVVANIPDPQGARDRARAEDVNGS